MLYRHRVLIVSGGDVVTMNRAREVLIGGSVAVAGSEIVAVGATTELLARFPGADRVDATGCVVTPGLVNTHHHLYQTLTRAVPMVSAPTSIRSSGARKLCGYQLKPAACGAR